MDKAYTKDILSKRKIKSLGPCTDFIHTPFIRRTEQSNTFIPMTQNSTCLSLKVGKPLVPGPAPFLEYTLTQAGKHSYVHTLALEGTFFKLKPEEKIQKSFTE